MRSCPLRNPPIARPNHKVTTAMIKDKRKRRKSERTRGETGTTPRKPQTHSLEFYKEIQATRGAGLLRCRRGGQLAAVCQTQDRGGRAPGGQWAIAYPASPLSLAIKWFLPACLKPGRRVAAVVTGSQPVKTNTGSYIGPLPEREHTPATSPRSKSNKDQTLECS